MAISIHVPSWGTTLCGIASFQVISISIHVPSWGTTLLLSAYLLSFHISIHVPSWGTTGAAAYIFHADSISIHVPSWGTTESNLIPAAWNSYFNPRSLVGNDGKFSQIFFVFLCNKYNFSTFYYPFSLFFSVIHVTFLIFVVRILPAFYVYF